MTTAVNLAAVWGPPPSSLLSKRPAGERGASIIGSNHEVQVPDSLLQELRLLGGLVPHFFLNILPRRDVSSLPGKVGQLEVGAHLDNSLSGAAWHTGDAPRQAGIHGCGNLPPQVGARPTTAHSIKTPTGSYNPGCLNRQGSTPDAVGPEHTTRLTIKCAGEFGPRSPGDTGHHSRSPSKQISREGETFPSSTQQTRLLASFTPALRPRAGDNIPSASRRACDPLDYPKHLDRRPLVLSCAVPLSRVRAASCRGGWRTKCAT